MIVHQYFPLPHRRHPVQLTERTRIRNHPERAVPEETAEILSQGLVAHLGFIEDGVPFVIPFTYHYDADTPDLIYLHGSVRSRALQCLADGAPVCITVTLTDGLVYSRKAMNHSVNHRSVALFGAAREVTDEREKFDLFDRMVQRYFPGRVVGHDYNAPPPADLGVTALVEVKIEERNAKARRGNPTGPDDDKPDAMGSAGVIDLREP
jgi:nitroimidazol reductase NimA-like FMN-containing flavoprotein (pyridoxamine 5'-phosphate oxidase superfamily)